MTAAFLTVALLVSPFKVDLAAKFNDISITQVLKQAKLFGLNVELPSLLKLEGRIKSVRIELRGDWIFANANGFLMEGDPLRWVRIVYNSKTREYAVTAEALGGLIELLGVLPKGTK